MLNATATTRSDRSTAITVHPSLMTSLKTSCISSGAPGSSYIPIPIAMHSWRIDRRCTFRASSIRSSLRILNSMAPVRSVPRQTGIADLTSFPWKKGYDIADRYERMGLPLVLRIPFRDFSHKISYRIDSDVNLIERQFFCTTSVYIGGIRRSLYKEKYFQKLTFRLPAFFFFFPSATIIDSRYEICNSQNTHTGIL